MNRVVITGLGCVSAIGLDAEQTWQSARDGRVGIGEITSITDRPLKVKIGAEVRGFRPEDHFDDRRITAYDLFSQFAVVAAREAVKDSGLALEGELAAHTAVITGTGIGGARTIDENSRKLYESGSTRVHPSTIPRLMPSAATSAITMECGITGPSFSVTSACASSTHAIGEAFWMVRTGRASAAITGGSEASFSWGSLPGWWALRVMDPFGCRPFSLERQGFVLGEGAGILVLENYDDARRRGAKIYAEVVGFGMSADADSMLEPSEVGAARAMSAALADAGLAPDLVDYVNAHGTGTQANDVNESRAVRSVFGAHADALAMTSTKAVHGHALGGAGAIECLLAARAVAEGVIPPTANFGTPDPECDLDYVPNTARQRPVRAALSNSFAFGGLNAVLALRAVA